MSSTVSVIIPAYNSEKTIKESITSVINQNYIAKTEIIVIDDNSTDDTKAIVTEMAAHNPNIICLSNKRKKGPSGARNTGLLKANGKYISFLDADDIWLPNHLEKGVNFLEKNKEIDVVFYNFIVFDPETNRQIGNWFSQRDFCNILNTYQIDNQYHVICDDMFNALLDESFIHVQSMIVKNKSAKNIYFNEGIKYSEDRDYSIRLSTLSNAKFAYSNEITGIYFRHRTSLTSITTQNSLSIVTDHISLFTEYFTDNTLNSHTITKLKRKLFERHMSASYYFRKLNNPKMAMEVLIKSFKYKITFSQAIEFAKIILSLHNSTFLRRIFRRP